MEKFKVKKFNGFSQIYKQCREHLYDTLNSPEKFTRWFRKKTNKYEFKCLECAKISYTKWRNIEENRLKRKFLKSRWDQNNREHINAYNRKYENNRKKIDPKFKLLKNLRKRIWKALKKSQKSYSTMKLTGISLDELKKHIESKFQDGMSWDNYGVWHIDHIIPCAQFDLSDPEQQKICFHYTNLQPMWAKDNMRKGARLNG